MMSKLITLEKKIDAIKSERDDLRSSYAKLAEALKLSVERNSKDIQGLKEMEKSFEPFKKTVLKVSGDQAELSRKLESELREVQNTKESLSDFKRNNLKDLMLIKEKMNSELERITREKEGLRKYTDDLKASFSEKKRDLETLEERLNSHMKKYKEHTAEILNKAIQMSDYINQIAKRTETVTENLRTKVTELEQDNEAMRNAVEKSKDSIDEKLKKFEIVMDSYTRTMSNTLGSKQIELERFEKTLTIKMNIFMGERDRIKKEFERVFHSLNAVHQEIEALKQRDMNIDKKISSSDTASGDHMESKMKDYQRDFREQLKSMNMMIRNQKSSMDRMESATEIKMEKLKEYMIIMLDRYAKEIDELKSGHQQHSKGASAKEKGGKEKKAGPSTEKILEEIVKELES
jgi:chromosome segregation ATPase